MPPGHSRILMSIDVLCSLFFLQFPRVVMPEVNIFFLLTPQKCDINNNIKQGSYTKKKVGAGRTMYMFDKRLCHF